MNLFLRGAGLVLALTPLAYPCGNLLKAAEAAPSWAVGLPPLALAPVRLPGAGASPQRRASHLPRG